MELFEAKIGPLRSDYRDQVRDANEIKREIAF
jgi:hypothetical protein